MKKILTSIIIAASLAGAFSCSKTESVTSKNGIPISIGIVNAYPTKAPVTGTVVPTSRTLVFSTYYNAEEGSSANYFTGINFTYSESNIWTTGKYWPLTGSLNFLGYCLDNNARVSSVSWGANNAASVTMTLADNSSNQDDLLVGGASALTKDSHAIAMKHAQALLVFKAKANVAYNAGTNLGITITDIKVNSSYHSGTVACTRDGGNIAFVWSALGAQKNQSLPSMSSTNLTTSYADISGTPGLILPGQSQTPITIYYTIHNGFASDGVTPNDNTLQYTFPVPGGSPTWDPMKKYTYNIDMTLTQITVNATVTDWLAQDPIPVPFG